MNIKISSEVPELVREHLHSMSLISPPESIHALNLDELKRPEMTFWSAWEEDELIGSGALKELDGLHGEIKSMRTSSSHLRKGVAKRLLQHIIEEAKQRGYRRLSLKRAQWLLSIRQEGFMPVLGSSIASRFRTILMTRIVSL